MITSQQVAAYCREHPGAKTAQIAAHFKVSDGYIRRLKREAGIAAAPVAVALNEPEPLPVFHDDSDVDMVAREHTMWRDPVERRLVRVAPGTHRVAWLHARNAIQREQRRREAAGVLVPLLPEQESTSVPVPVLGTMASRSDSTAVPVPVLSLVEPGGTAGSAPRLLDADGMSEPAVIVRTFVRTVYIRPGLLTALAVVPGQVWLALIVGLWLIYVCAAGVP